MVQRKIDLRITISATCLPVAMGTALEDVLQFYCTPGLVS